METPRVPVEKALSSAALQTVVAIARAAGDIIMKVRAEGTLQTRLKSGPLDPVTEADLASQRFILDQLRLGFPGDSFVAEEDGKTIQGDNDRCWFVDPLDGTKEFARGGDGFSVMIGRATAGVPDVGVVYAPARDELYAAARGLGAWTERGGVRTALAVSGQDRLERATQVTRLDTGEVRPEDEIFKLLECAADVRASSVGLKLGLIARGGADVHANSQMGVSPWDTCAPQAILEAAGGKVTDFDGKPLEYSASATKAWPRSFVATNARLHDAAVAILSGWKRGRP